MNASSRSSFPNFGRHAQDALQLARSDPVLEAAVAGLVRRIFLRQLAPPRSRAQHPQNSIEYSPHVLPRTIPIVGTSQGTQKRFDQPPLGIAKFPSASRAFF